MSRMLRDINVGAAIMIGVASGYYIYEPLLRKHALQRKEVETERQALAEATQKPQEEIEDLPKATHAPFMQWLTSWRKQIPPAEVEQQDKPNTAQEEYEAEQQTIANAAQKSQQEVEDRMPATTRFRFKRWLTSWRKPPD